MHDSTKTINIGPPEPNATVTQIDGHPAEAIGPVTIPGYTLQEVIGRGGMGVVYRARDHALNREVAVKVLLGRFSPKSGTAARFLEEAQITSQLQHPGIPAVYQVGLRDDGRPYLAMKLIKGSTLEELMRTGQPINVLAVFEATAQAVAYAHAHGVIHRDLKPHNVMVGAFGEVQVMDWGLAKLLTGGGGTPREYSPDDATLIHTDRESIGSQTQAGSILGTPAYMPPEQAAGLGDQINERSDVFGLGAILCQMLTGVPPFTGDDPETIRCQAVRGNMTEAMAKLETCAAEPDVVALCRQCLSFEPADRPANAGELAKQVASLRFAAEERAKQAELETARAEVQVEEQKKRRKVFGISATAIGVTMALGATLAGWQASQANKARNVAVLNEGKAVAAANAERLAKETAEKQTALAIEAEADTKAYADFFANHILAASRPAGVQGGVGASITLAEAIASAETQIATVFEGRPKAEALARYEIGVTWRNLGKYEAAVQQLERALELRMVYLGHRHRDTLMAMNSLGVACLGANQLARAIALHEQAREYMSEELGAEHMQTLVTGMNLAVDYGAAGQWEKAIPLYEQVSEAQTRVCGPENGHTLDTLSNLAMAYGLQRNFKKAIAIHERVAEAQGRTLGEDSPITAVTLGNLAREYRETHQLDKAIPLYEKVCVIYSRHYGAEHVDTFTLLNEMAFCYRAAGNLARAIAILKPVAEAMERRGFRLPDDTPILSNLASFYEQNSQPELADPLRRKLLIVILLKFGDGSPNHAVYLSRLAENLMLQGKYADAEEGFRKSLEIARPRNFPPAVMVFLQSLLGDALYFQKKYAEAETLYLEAHAAYRDRKVELPANGRNRPFEAIQRLARLYDAMKEPEKAKEWRSKLPREIAPAPRSTKVD